MVVPWKVYECQPEVENPVNDDYHRCLDWGHVALFGVVVGFSFICLILKGFTMFTLGVIVNPYFALNYIKR
jgi:hypothetical protein